MEHHRYWGLRFSNNNGCKSTLQIMVQIFILLGQLLVRSDFFVEYQAKET